MKKCKNPSCPCVCDDPYTHHELAWLSGNAEVNTAHCYRREPTVPASEHQRVQAERDNAVAAATAYLQHVHRTHSTDESPITCAHPACRDAPLLLPLARTLLEEMEGLRRANAAMAARLAPDWSRWIGPCVHGRDPWDRCDTCEEAGEAQSIVWVLDKERKEHAAEVRRAVEEAVAKERAECERDADGAVTRDRPAAGLNDWQKGYSTGRQDAASAIRARGKAPEK